MRMRNQVGKMMLAAALMLIAAPAWAQTKIAVVNVATVSEKYQKTKELEAQFEGLRKSLGQQRDAMKEKIERAGKALQEELKPGTDEYRQRRKEIAMLEAELQWFVESEGQRVEKGLAESLRSIFDDIQNCVREVAEQQGYQVVVAADHIPAESPDTPNQARQTILLQKVLYWRPEIDITDAVIGKLNQQYKPGSATTPASVQPKAGGKPGETKKP
jgi:Skp family chaperone for outer membrane proteins